VASLAGVSHTTVSRYLQDKDSLKPKTRIKVEYAVKTLDYRPNLVARSMRTRHTNRLAIVLASGDHFPGRLLAAASRTAHEGGFQVEIVSVEGGSAARSVRVDELARSGQVEGILALSPLNLKGKKANRVPIVESSAYDDKLHDLAEFADADEIRQIVEYLAGLGHRTFLHLSGDLENFTSARNRKQVYLDTIERLGLISVGAVDGDWSAQSGYDAITMLPADTAVTAVVAANDIIAMGAIRAASERGWSVPGDLSVFGWNDDEMGRFTTPSLSTVSVDREAQGRALIRRLVAEIRNEPVPAPPTGINSLIFRESTAPPPVRRG
jgi:DNA-binding LacI/PurR family transcriptional regulator